MAVGKIDEEALAAIRARIGVEWRRREPWNNEVATKDAIRHFAYGIGDENPLWWDEEYAKKSRYGGIIAPPCFLYTFGSAGSGGGLPGLHGLYAGDDWEFYLPVRVNDSITCTSKLVDVFVKQSQYAGKAVHRISEATYRNQRGESVARMRHYQINFERGEGQRGNKYKDLPLGRYTAEQLAAIEADYDREEMRGASPRYWEDAPEGVELTPVVKGPLTATDVIAWQKGLGPSPFIRAHRFGLAYRRRHPAVGVADPETGIPDIPERVHWDNAMARAIGMPAAYDYGPQRVSWLSHLMTNWIGDDGWLKRLNVQLRRPNFLGDTTWCKGKVTKKYMENGEHLVECRIWAESQRGEITALGQAIVALPSRETGAVGWRVKPAP